MHTSHLALLLLLGVPTLAQDLPNPPPANYDESNVGTYTLPDPLVLPNGQRITRAKQWEEGRREAVLKLFNDTVYGQMPGPVSDVRYVLQRVDSAVLGGKAVRKFVRAYFGAGDTAPHMDMMVYLPKAVSKAPVFVTLNYGNHTLSPDPTIPLPDRPDVSSSAPPTERGSFARRWPFEQLIDAGFGLATANYADLEPDRPTGWQTGIRTTLQAQTGLKPEQWCAIGAWAWGMSRILDYIETDPGADARRTIVQGHSRLGKAALWAGANDRRFAMVVSNNSGEGGAALARRNFGETIRTITNGFPHWFTPAYKTYAHRVHDLPVDQHELLALIAPRPLYVTSASEDHWADQRGEFLSLKAAAPVWWLYTRNATLGEMPGVDAPVRAGQVGYHIRTGPHDVLPYDWAQYVAHAKAVGLVP